MEIRRLAPEDASSWAWDAANSIVDTRMASGGISRAGTTKLTRAITSTFSRGIPYDMDVWIDSEGGWVWFERDNDFRVTVRAGFLDAKSDISQWADFIRKELAGAKVSWRIWGEKDSLGLLVDALGAEANVVVLSAAIAAIETSTEASSAWLRAMGAGELMRFQVAAANELGAVMAASGEYDSVDQARRQAFREIENQLSDGVSSPGHYLYSLCYEGRTVGGTWMEIDGGMAVVHAVVLDGEERSQGHRRAAIGALAGTAHSHGARSMQITVTTADYRFLEALLNMGMDIISVDYAQEFAPMHTSALQNA